MTHISEDEKPGAPRRKLVIFAPYPPARSGIADYVAELMPNHRREFDVTLVIADDAPIPTDGTLRTLLASEYRKHRAHFESELKLYHMGNNPHHCYMLDFIASDPGTVVLHDYNLNYLHETASLNWGDRELYLSAMEREYGALGRDIVQWQLENDFRETFAGYEMPLNGDVLESATAIVVHSRHAQYKVAARVPHKPVWHIPHHLSPRAVQYSTLAKSVARAQLGLPADDIIVTAAGFVTRAKQIAMTLEALRSLRGRVPRFKFVLAGQRRPQEYDVDADIAKWGMGNMTVCCDYVDEDSFFKHLVAADILVNLRYPSGGETSGTLVRALGLGVPTLVLDFGPMAEFPDNVVKKIAWGANAQASLTQALSSLMTNPAERQFLGARARQHVQRKHAIAKTAGRLNRVILGSSHLGTETGKRIRLHFPHTKYGARRLRAMNESGHETVRRSNGRIWWKAACVPLGRDPAHKALVVDPDHRSTTNTLSKLYDWPLQAITGMAPDEFLAEEVRDAHGVPLGTAQFVFALAVVPACPDETSAALLLRRLNAALQRGGTVTIETWDSNDFATSRCGLLGAQELAKRLRDAGFSEIEEKSQQDGFIADLILQPSLETTRLRRAICISARKVSDYAVWRYCEAPDGIPLRWGGRVGSA